MSSTEIKKRKRAVKIAAAVSSINGVPVSDFAKELSDKWVQGNISDSQMIEILINAHKRI